MRLSELVQNAVKLDIGVGMLMANNSNKYNWVAVKNSKKSYLEIGGNKNELVAYIPYYEDNKWKTYPNGYIHGYRVSIGEIALSGRYLNTSFNTREEILNWLENTDFKTWKPEYEEIYEMREVYLYSKLIN